MNGRSTIYLPVLVLNQNYQPLNICNVRRAFVLIERGKAELVTDGRGLVRCVATSYPAPSVIRLVYMVKRPVMRRRLSRQAIFYRDV
ncbi:MAG TPA: HNH endonuclease, partial [Dehalococcoidia bacterium]|nr:HNH endonuclease [Dehalococcoidia bacterium]